MTFVGSYTIDPKDYPFQKIIDEQKELDTDELRYTIKPVIRVIDKDFKGEEHKFCDKEQLCPLGKYKRSKMTVEAEKRGFTSGIEMMEADKKAEEEAKNIAGQALGKEVDDLRQYKTLSEERFEKMGRLIADQNKMMEFLMAKLK
jgi:hypothetical protein